MTYTAEIELELIFDPCHGLAGEEAVDAMYGDYFDGAVYLEVTVSGTVTPFVRGVKSGPPERCYDDEGGEVETIGFAASYDGVPLAHEAIEWLMTPKDHERAEQALRDVAADDDGGYDEDREDERDDGRWR